MLLTKVLFILLKIDKYLESDTVFAVKQSLIRKLEKSIDENKQEYIQNINK